MDIDTDEEDPSVFERRGNSEDSEETQRTQRKLRGLRGNSDAYIAARYALRQTGVRAWQDE